MMTDADAADDSEEPEIEYGARYTNEEAEEVFNHIHNTLFQYHPTGGENHYIIMEWHSEDGEWEIVDIGSEIILTK